MQRRALKAELLPMRMLSSKRYNIRLSTSPRALSGRNSTSWPAADDFDRRADRGHVPTGIPLRIFVAGRQIDAAITVQLVQQVPEAFFERDGGRQAGYVDSARRSVGQLCHMDLREGLSAELPA